MKGPIEPADGVGGKDAVQTSAAPRVNKTAVVALLGLLLVAAIPPAVFCVLVGRFRKSQKHVGAAAIQFH
jgi:hypothetical protein